MIDPKKYWKNYEIRPANKKPLASVPISNVVSICSHIGYIRVRPEIVSKDGYASTSKKLQDKLESTGQVTFEGECCVCVIDAK